MWCVTLLTNVWHLRGKWKVSNRDFHFKIHFHLLEVNTTFLFLSCFFFSMKKKIVLKWHRIELNDNERHRLRLFSLCFSFIKHRKKKQSRHWHAKSTKKICVFFSKKLHMCSSSSRHVEMYKMEKSLFIFQLKSTHLKICTQWRMSHLKNYSDLCFRSNIYTQLKHFHSLTTHGETEQKPSTKHPWKRSWKIK